MRVAVRATLAVILLSAVPLLAVPMPGRSHIQRGYCRLMLRCLGVRITVSGGPIRNLRGVLVVSGHVSWVDIFAIGAVMPGSFVAKAEMIDWPALGAGRASDEGHPDRAGEPAPAARRRVDGRRLDCAQGRPWWPSLRAPRGAAWRTGAFRPAMFQAAVDAGRPVQPLRLNYHHRDGKPSTVAVLRRRRHLARVDPPARHRPPHHRARAGRVAAVAGNRPARPGGPLRGRRPPATRRDRRAGHALAA